MLGKIDARVSTPDRTVGESVTHDNIAGICNQKIDFGPTWLVWGRLVGNPSPIGKVRFARHLGAIPRKP